jgi:hypothetical protein
LTPDSPLEQLLAHSQTLKAQIAALGEMRPGSLVERHRKCGKPNCHCARRGARGHDPDWILTRPVKGKTVTRAIPEGPALEQTRVQVEEYKRFRELVRQLIEVNERICEIRFQKLPSADEPADKKKRTGRRTGR